MVRALDRAGFTLIELLIVVGVIVLLLGGAALALAGRGGEGAALSNAQSLVAGLVGATRAQAALHHTKARLVVYAQMPPATNANVAERYLRTLIVLREDPVDSGRYVAVSDPVTLPAPICVVPPAPVPANHLRLPTGQTWNNNPAMGPVSTLTVANGFSYRGQATSTTNQFFGTQGGSGRIFYLEMDHTGAVTSPTGTTPTKIALSTAILGPNALPLFNNAFIVRGLFVRKSGGIALVDEATGF